MKKLLAEKRKGAVDRMAAVLVLEDYVAAQASREGRSETAGRSDPAGGRGRYTGPARLDGAPRSLRRFRRTVFVNLAHGTSSWSIGEKLSEAGVVRNPWLYQLARLTKPGKPAQAGEYRFAEAATPEVVARLAAGDVFLIEVRVPEGSNVLDIAATVEHAGLGTARAFLAEARSPELIRDIAPDAPSLEGFLFPAMYRFRRNAPLSDVCRAMTAQFRRVWREVNPRGGDPNRSVTLASMVEKEAVLAGERARIAGVYAARLRIGMKLDCDPTVVYASLLEGHWTGVIHRSEPESRTATHVPACGTAAGSDREPGPRIATGRARSTRDRRILFRCRARRQRRAHVFKRHRRAREGRGKLSSWTAQTKVKARPMRDGPRKRSRDRRPASANRPGERSARRAKSNECWRGWPSAAGSA